MTPDRDAVSPKPAIANGQETRDAYLKQIADDKAKAKACDAVRYAIRTGRLVLQPNGELVGAPGWKSLVKRLVKRK